MSHFIGARELLFAAITSQTAAVAVGRSTCFPFLSWKAAACSFILWAFWRQLAPLLSYNSFNTAKLVKLLSLYDAAKFALLLCALFF